MCALRHILEVRRGKRERQKHAQSMLFAYEVPVIEECSCDQNMTTESEECFQAPFRAWVNCCPLESGGGDGRWLDKPKPLL